MADAAHGRMAYCHWNTGEHMLKDLSIKKKLYFGFGAILAIIGYGGYG